MSLAELKAEGHGAKLRFTSHGRKNQPVLQRNLRKSLQFLVMGSTLSALGTPLRTRPRAESAALSEDEDEKEVRPSKRRKLSMTGPKSPASRIDNDFGSRYPFDQVTNEKARGPRTSSKIKSVKPSDFYGRSRVAESKINIPRRQDLRPCASRISDIVPKYPANFKKALRIDISSVLHTATNDEATTFLRSRKGPIDVKCRCSVALFSGKNDEDLNARIENKDYAMNLRMSRICTLRTTVSDRGDAKRELINLEPFVVPAEEFLVNRKKRNRQGQIIESFELAEKHWIQITLEPVGPQRDWPPFDRSSLTNEGGMEDGSYETLNPVLKRLEVGSATMSEAYIFGQINDILDPCRQNRSISLKLCCGSTRQARQKIPYALKMETNWSLPSHMSDWPTKDIKIEADSPRAKIASVPAISETVPASPSARKGKEISLPDSPADARAQRRRANVPTYNLKALSALQQGRSPRAPKTRDVRSTSAQTKQDDGDGIIVTYTLGKGSFADLSTKREITVTSLCCPFCTRDYSSLDNLAFHLRMTHDTFKFSLRRSNPQRIGFFLSLARQGSRSSSIPLLEQSRTFQLNQPRTLFDLEKFLNGDESWTKAREGPQHNFLPEHLQERFRESSLSSSPYDSRHSSPNTSNDTDDVMDLENYYPKAIRSRKKHYVPQTSKPLFDTVTKQVLEPGAEIPNSDEEKDEGWLHQKHRDIIMDFTDVTDDEKDYIIRWNPFIMNEQLTCETYLSDAVLRFVETNKFWFGERASRKRELGKTMESFIMRGVVSEECFEKCILILKEAEKMGGSKEKEAMEEERPVSPIKQRGALDCMCGKHSQPQDRVVCRGKTCPGRFFHRKCAENSGRIIRGIWLCDRCVS